MTKEQLTPWIEKLMKAEPKDRNVVVGEMCKENHLKIGDAWKALKEAGYDSKAAPPAGGAPQSGDIQGADQQGETTTPDNAEADPVDGVDTQPSDSTPPVEETEWDADNQGGGNTPQSSSPEQKPAKKRIRHEKLKGKNLIAGNKTIAFDADGIAELDAADAARLLSIPGYTEVGQA